MSAAEPAQKGPSWSAYSVALLRAQHQVVEDGAIFRDPLAIPITGRSADAIAQGARDFPQFTRLRQYIVARSRFGEDTLAEAVGRGVRQVVVLGAGLDTFGLRNPHAATGVRVFEVDRPETQRLKRQCLKNANLQVPSALTFVGVDFERQSFLNQLTLAGFRTKEPSFFIWMGVVVYLTRKAVAGTLATIASLADAEIVFDYGIPPASFSQPERARYEAMIARSARHGEPWRSVFEPEEIQHLLARLGFSEIEDIAPVTIVARHLPNHEIRGGGGHFVRTRKHARSGD